MAAEGSPNRAMIGSLISTLQKKVEPNLLYDALRKITEDLEKVYKTLFTGPLPAVDGSQLELADIEKDDLPLTIAYEDEPNVFLENQKIRKLYPSYEAEYGTDAAPGSGNLGRFKQILDNQTLFSNNLDYDGGAWVSDSGNGAGVYFSGEKIYLLQFLSGVLKIPLYIDANQVIRIGDPASVTGAGVDEIVIENSKYIRGTNAAANNTLPIIRLDGNNLVSLGSNPAGATTGEGNISIPRAAVADLPTAGATRNGILIIDDTNNRLCYYSSGNRYYLPIGTAF